MKKATILLGFALLPFFIMAQAFCYDTLFNTSLYHPSFKYIYASALTPFLDNDSSTFYAAQGIMIKKNKANNFIWKKRISINPKFVSNGNNIMGIFENYDPNSPTNGDRGFVKMNSNGTILWAKKIVSSNVNSNGSDLIYYTQKGKNDDFVFNTYKGSTSVNLTVIDSSATIVKLNKIITVNFTNNERIREVLQTTYSNNSIFITLIVESFEETPKIEKNYLLVLKVNCQTGALQAAKYFNSNDEHIGKLFYGFSTKFIGALSVAQNCKITDNGSIIISGKKSMSAFEETNRLNCIMLDTNLNVINNKVFKYPNSFGLSHVSSSNSLPSINRNGSVFFASIKDSIDVNEDHIRSGDCYYFTVDSNFNITNQQVQNIADVGLNSAGANIEVIPFLKNNIDGEIVYATNFSEADSVLHIVQLNDKIKANNCMGNPTNLITTETPTYTIHPTPQITVTEGSTLTLTPFTMPAVTDEVVEERKFCQQISICDTIKIHGNTKHCLSNPNASFTVYKNPQCLRKIKWVINDSTSIKTLNTPNDSTINVQFLKPYHGYIYVEVDGCVLKDSMFLDVNKPMPFLNIGNDTMLCPNKIIALQAATGFKTYKWQDGSTTNNYTVTQAGTYSLTATDSCENVFTDTIKIKPNDVNFLLNYPNSICLYDTATISLTSKLKNYTWSPQNTATLIGSALQFYPTQTTNYTVTAERLPGCLFTDTVLIKVENCPTYVIFPTAFTPNNDYNNDVFKAITMGKIEQYELKIYNRYGAVVFNTKNISKGWNGAIQGIQQPTGAYIWVCSYKLKNNPAKVINGTVLLLR